AAVTGAYIHHRAAGDFPIATLSVRTEARVAGALPPGVSLRPIRPEDRAFLMRVYAATRAAEIALLPWTDMEKDAFVTMQFEAQHQCYQDQFAGARFDVIELRGEPAGRLYVDRRDGEIR